MGAVQRVDEQKEFLQEARGNIDAIVEHAPFDEFFYQWSFSEDVMSSGPSVDFSVLFLVGVRY